MSPTSASHFQQFTRHLEDIRRSEALHCFASLMRGIEKEGLRITPEGRLSSRRHPELLGSALTHKYITTDYSEALLEFITPVYTGAEQALAFLADTHAFAAAQIGDELIWPGSMPCALPSELDIPIAEYGSSNIGQLKHIYRHGLWHRYGRRMQCIAGIHYNFSMPQAFWPLWQDLNQGTLLPGSPTLEGQDFITSSYFGLARNFRRYSWLLMYLFGASSALCSSFFSGRQPHLQKVNNSYYQPYATSLRMSDMGYQSKAQASLFICYNGLDTYIDTLDEAIHTSYPAYEDIGLIKQGQYQQLNTNVLQIENEYYSDVRPKRAVRSGQKPLAALRESGVEYLEIRCLDLNPYAPYGLDEEQIAFMDVFLVFCLLYPSEYLPRGECFALTENLQTVVHQGLDPVLTLSFNGHTRKLSDWAQDLFETMQPVAQLLDEAQGTAKHSQALQSQLRKLSAPETTPAGQLLNELLSGGQDYIDIVLRLAQQHKDVYLHHGLSSEQQLAFVAEAQRSIQAQKQIESMDKMDFDSFLQAYLS